MAIDTLEKSVSPIAIASTLFLSAPFYRDNNGKWRLSSVMLAVSLLVRIPSCGVAVYLFSRKVVSIDVTSDGFLMLSFGYNLLVLWYRIFFMLSTATKYKDIVEILNEIKDIGAKIPLRKFSYKYVFMICLLEVLFIIPQSLFIIIHLIMRGQLQISTPFTIMTIVSTHMQEIHSVNFFLIIKGFVLSLQGRIEDLIQEAKTTASSTNFINIADISLTKTKPKVLTWKTTASDLADIHVLYRRVWDIKTKINEVYSLQLLVAVGTTFFQLTYYAYINFLIRTNLAAAFAALTESKVYAIRTWSAVMTVKIVWIVGFCHSVSDAFKKTGPLLHKLSATTVDPQVKQEVAIFSAELLHLEPNISAYGVFDMNNSLILSMAGSLVMYFLILIQADFNRNTKPSSIFDSILYFA